MKLIKTCFGFLSAGLTEILQSSSFLNSWKNSCVLLIHPGILFQFAIFDVLNPFSKVTLLSQHHLPQLDMVEKLAKKFYNFRPKLLAFIFIVFKKHVIVFSASRICFCLVSLLQWWLVYFKVFSSFYIFYQFNFHVL